LYLNMSTSIQLADCDGPQFVSSVYFQFFNPSIEDRYASSMRAVTFSLRGTDLHSKLTGLELPVFVKFQESGITSLPSDDKAGKISKAQSICAMLMNMVLRARCIPGHILRPNPNGMSKLCSRGSVVSKNRSGRKASGEGNISGSCIMPLRPSFRLRHM